MNHMDDTAEKFQQYPEFQLHILKWLVNGICNVSTKHHQQNLYKTVNEMQC